MLSTEEMLDHLCWCIAVDGENFYPPNESAEKCLSDIENPSEENIQYEQGYHTAHWLSAVDRFEKLEVEGFNPKGRAERHIRSNDLDLPEPDWEWYDSQQE